jgi:hypothetical protein
MHFLDLRIKSYGCLKFQREVWAGRACARANQQELTTCAKSGGQEEKKIQEKWKQPERRRCRPVVASCRLAASRHLRLSGCSKLFLIFFNLKKRFFGSLGNGPGLLGEWVYNTPII